MKAMEELKKKLLDMSHQERMDLQQAELAESLVDNYNLDTAQKAIVVDDLDQLLEMNRKQTYRKTEIGEDGIMYYPQEGEDEVSNRTIHIGNTYTEATPSSSQTTPTTKKTNALSKYIPLAVAGLLGSSAIAAALLWPKGDVSPPSNVDTNTVTSIGIVE